MQFVLNSKTDYKFINQLSSIGCRLPYKTIEILSTGDITLCCYSWLPHVCGNIINDSIEDIFSNLNRKLILDSIDTGKFTYCNDQCPHLNKFISTGVKDYAMVDTNELRDKVLKDHYVINFTYDLSCNLQCPSCRKDLILYKLNEDRKLQTIHEKVKELVSYLIDSGEKVTIHITGSGDPFASPLYYNYLLELSNTSLPESFRIKLLTNGILMTPKVLDELKPLWKHFHSIGISIDSASSKTYSIVRKNGNFEKLKNNLNYFDNCVQQKLFPGLVNWQSNFVVQSINYKEILDFAKWQIRYTSINHIYYNLIAQWGHLSNNEFSNMTLKDNEIDDLTNILADPIFNDPKIILGNLINFKK